MNIPSPCIHVCRLDERGICTGCRRTRDEIARWLEMAEGEKCEIVAALAARKLEVSADE